jgi:mRNA-degrading endonuclease RelE of RelBE toxin-antitoxin system
MRTKPFSVKEVMECEEFTKLIKKNTDKDLITNSCKTAIKSFKFSNNPPQICLLYEDCVYQVWKFRIPNPNCNRGLSAGFRLYAYFNKENLVFYLYKIFKKNDIDKIPDIDGKIKKEIKKNLLI